MNKLKGKVGEALKSVTPISLLVVALSALIVPMPAEILMLFLVGAVLLIVGMGFFSLPTFRNRRSAKTCNNSFGREFL
ncbi:hypothetical protein RAH42_08520 [Pyramidobacter sp. YE332]|uniref:hypothetical protein n=1 Tax=Pyramidobacter sp. YE332 TaxID=3068894 RepID=UPI00294AE368|nr:hypothetical protein [Pyramidobacter sp. YE332]WOL39195.1 hypothetical protein RAH42_08520 [Pyramidobacter sp. YE332]